MYPSEFKITKTWHFQLGRVTIPVAVRFRMLIQFRLAEAGPPLRAITHQPHFRDLEGESPLVLERYFHEPE